MRELFDQLLAEGEAGIDRLVAERTQESVTLDFKSKADPRHGLMKDEDRRYFAKALSAFANSAGGLLIFGVDARKVDGVDCAQEAKPIADIERFKSEATRASGDQLQPRHDGIRVEAIASKKHSGAGYLLVYVERSERRPHRSEAAGQKQYFKRAGDNSFEMEHYDIEDAFRRVSTPRLAFSMNKSGSAIAGPVTTHYVALQLTNGGSITAKYPYIHIGNLINCVVDNRVPPYFAYGSFHKWSTFTGGADHVINPGVTIAAGYFAVEELDGRLKPKLNSRHGGCIEFLWKFGCENTRMQEGEFMLNWDEWQNSSIVISS